MKIISNTPFETLIGHRKTRPIAGGKFHVRFLNNVRGIYDRDPLYEVLAMTVMTNSKGWAMTPVPLDLKDFAAVTITAGAEIRTLIKTEIRKGVFFPLEWEYPRTFQVQENPIHFFYPR